MTAAITSRPIPIKEVSFRSIDKSNRSSSIKAPEADESTAPSTSGSESGFGESWHSSMSNSEVYSNTNNGLGSSLFDDILPPLRSLTMEEQVHLGMLLRELLQSKKKSSPSEENEDEDEDEDEDDISDLINYTCEMIEDKMCVKDILQEIDFMDLQMCQPPVLVEIRKVLALFLSELQDDATVDASTATAGSDKSTKSSRAREQQQEKKCTINLQKPKNLVPIDLSAKTAKKKQQKEATRTLSRGMSVKDRMSVYKSNVEVDAGELNGGQEKGVHDTQKSIDQLKHDELIDVMNDATLTTKEQTDKIKAIRAKYGLMQMQSKIDKAKKTSDVAITNSKKVELKTRSEKEVASTKGRRSSIDLSAKSYKARRRNSLVKTMQRQETNLSDRKGMLMTCLVEDSEKKIEEPKVIRTHLATTEDEKAKIRRDEMMKIMRRKSLNKLQKATKMKEVKSKYTDPEEQIQQQENVKVLPSWQVQQEEKTETRTKSEEVKAIMKNRNLSAEERKQQLNLVKWKYSSSSSQPNMGSTVNNIPARRPSKTTKDAKTYMQRRRSSIEAMEKEVKCDGAKYANRRRDSIESLKKAMQKSAEHNGGNGGGGAEKRVLSLRERIALLSASESDCPLKV